MASTDVVVFLKGRTEQFQASMAAAGGATERLDQNVATRMQNIGRSIAGVGLKMTTHLTLPIVAAGAVAFKMASDLNESMNKVSVVFAGDAGGIKKWSKNAATQLGISRQEALESAGTFGNLFRALGLGTKPASEMSRNLVGLASDLASFNNANPEDVLLALRSGLVGEVEPLRKFGVSLNEARLKQKALELGIGDGTSVLTPAQKAQAAYAIIVQDTALAQGDFARTSDGAANKQRILTAQVKDLAANIGTKLLPIGQKLLGWVSGLLSKFDGLSPGVQNIILGFLGLVAVAGPLTTVIGGLVAVVGFLISPVGLVILAIVALVAAVYLLWTRWDEVWNAIKEHPALAAITALFLPFIAMLIATVGVVKYVYENWAAIWAQIQAVAQTVWDAIKGYVLAGVQIVTGVVNFGLAVIQGRWGDAWNAMGQVLGGIWAFIRQAVSDGIQNVVGLIASLPDRFVSYLSRLFGIGVTYGAQLMQGLYEGLKSWGERAVAKAKDIAGQVVDAIADVIIPGSPSRVTLEYGKNLAQGLAVGMDSWKAQLAEQARVTATLAVPRPQGGLGVASPAGAGTGGGARGGGVFNQTNNITVTSADGAHVVSAIKEYERRSGAGWRNN